MKAREYNGSEVTIMVCSDCNTDCKHCYISYKGNFDGQDLLDLCKKLNVKYKVILNGTELLLHPEYFNSMQCIGQESLMTNGIEMIKNPSIIQKIIDAGIKYVGISYHFYIHNDISSVNKSIIERILKILEDYDITTEIRVTITTKNFDKVRDICKNAIAMHANGVKFTNYMYMGSAMHLGRENILSDEQICVFFDELEEVRRLYSKEEFLIRRCGSFGKSKYRDFRCPAGKESVVITPDLKVYPCIFLAKPGWEIGYLENGKIMLDKEIKHDGMKCLAKEINNNA